MARVSDNVYPSGTQVGLTIDRVAELMRWNINAFNGLNYPEDPFKSEVECNSIWSQTNRDQLAIFIQEAEQRREQQLNYHLGKKVIFQEQTNVPANMNPFFLQKKHLTKVGYPTLDDIEAGYPLAASYAAGTDPVEIVITTAVATSEIAVCYAGETVKINPTSITATTPTYGSRYVTIKIPWARLIKPALNDDRDDPLAYSDTDNYVLTVDVKRSWFDLSRGAEYLWLKPCCREVGFACTDNCEIQCQAACVRIAGDRASRLSQIWLEPATFSGQTPTVTSWAYSSWPDLIRVTYESGKVSMLNELASIKFGFALMPFSPCDCKAVTMYWQDAKTYVPGTLTPYGSTRGAIDAWVQDSQQRVGVGGMLGQRINWGWR
jgi:hypothetical protein